MTMRATMLGFARQAILARAAADGYSESEYNPESDHEGYVISLLNALHHWCHAYGHDWTAELNRAQALFEEDIEECREQRTAVSSD